MKKIFSFESPVVYFAAGLFFNLIFLAVLEFVPAAHFNVQFPEGAFRDNIWGVSSDVWSYYEPAQNFLSHGVFGVGTVSDIHRTVGYPFFSCDVHEVFLVRTGTVRFFFCNRYCSH